MPLFRTLHWAHVRFSPGALRFACIPLILLGSLAAGAPTIIPPGFSFQTLAPGTTWTHPLGVTFAPDGRIFVFEKRGRVYIVKNGVKLATPFIAIDSEVLSNGDRGLLDFALDPAFAQNGHVYLLYTVDPNGNGVDDDNDGFGRLTRYTASASNPDVIDPGSRTVLIGSSFATGVACLHDSHATGSLRFARDGTLLVSTGDGAHYETLDPGGLDEEAFGPGELDPLEDIGCFRSLWIGSLAGKILRIDPATGRGLPSNPFYTGNPLDNESLVWAYGLRNPYRFDIRPGTGSLDPSAGSPGTLYIGDVGWVTWEEVNVSKLGGESFGWPCREGLLAAKDYPNLDPAHTDCGSTGSPGNPSPRKNPLLVWHHSSSTSSTPPGIPAGHAAAAVAFYSGTSYPAAYRGALFFGDYTANWIRVARLDASDNVIETLGFFTGAEGPVNICPDPVSGDLYLVSLTTQTIRRIVYTGTNQSPTANASASPASGTAPLTVQFSSAGSTDLDGDPLSYTWAFGDGETSTAANPSHTYASAGSFNATLTVSDGRGGQGSDSVSVSVSPPGGNNLVAAILAPADHSLHDPALPLTCRGTASGFSGSAAALEYSWSVNLHHNSHDHPGFRTGSGAEFTFTPGAHDDGTGTWLEITLRVEDASGSVATATVSAYPSDRAIIVDNGRTGTSWTGSWPVSGAAGSYGTTSVYSKSTTGLYTFSDITGIPGTYAVFEWHSPFDSRNPSARHTIHHAGGTTAINVNQKVNGSRWNYLGRFEFGATRKVVIASVGSQYSTCADAMSFVLLDGDASGNVEVILDNGQPGTTATGGWSVSGGANPYGGSSVYSKNTATYRYQMPLPQAGSYDVYAWWTILASRSPSVPYRIIHANGTTTVTRDQRTLGGQWNKLGTFSFGTAATIEILSSSGSYSYCADAVRLVKAP